MKKIIFNIFITIFLLASSLHSQTETDSNKIVQEEDTLFVMSKSPWGAVLRSAIVPGLGQFYNESYWKVPLIFGAVAYFAFQWNNNNNKYLEYRDLYTDGLVTGDINTSAYLQLREFYKDERNLFAIFIGVIYFLNLVDAYVDAHLFDFDVSENPQTQSIQLNLRIPF